MKVKLATGRKRRDRAEVAEQKKRVGVEGPPRGREEGKRQEGREGGEEVNLHILERAGFFIKKRLKLIYACALLTHCTL